MKNQVLRKNGIAFDNQSTDYYKSMLEDSDQPPNPGNVLLSEEYSDRLYTALKNKTEKNKYDWLIITIDMGCYGDDLIEDDTPLFYSACNSFWLKISQNDDMRSLKRVFIFLENDCRHIVSLEQGSLDMIFEEILGQREAKDHQLRNPLSKYDGYNSGKTKRIWDSQDPDNTH